MRCRPPSTSPCCSQRAEDAADGVQRRARHLGDVLPADRKIDLDAGVDLLAGLLGQPQQRMRHALLDLFVRQLQHAGLGVLQAAADGLQRARGQRRIFGDQAIPGGRRPGERDAVDGGHRGRRIMRQVHRLRDAEQFAARNIADDGLLPLRCGLFDTKMAVKQQVEAIGFRALVEDRSALRVSNQTRSRSSSSCSADVRPANIVRFATSERSREAIDTSFQSASDATRGRSRHQRPPGLS